MSRFCNVLVVGQTGVGKSSLINYLTGTSSALVGVGRPVTSKDDVSSYPAEYQGIPILLFDSWGIETDKVKDWKNRITKIIGEHNGNASDVGASWFHTIIYCIACGNSRIQPTDEEMIKYFQKEGFSVIVALTKADMVNDDDLETMEKSLPNGVIFSSISSGAKTRYGVSEGFGKDELFAAMVKETLSNLPTRLRLYLRGYLNKWKESMYHDIKYKFDISRFGNSNIEDWINRSGKAQFDSSIEMAKDFISYELKVLSSWSVSVEDDNLQYHLESLPKDDTSMGAGAVAAAIVFAPVAIVGGLLYGLFCGVDDERKKLLSMVDNAAGQIQDYINKRSNSLDNTLKKLIL